VSKAGFLRKSNNSPDAQIRNAIHSREEIVCEQPLLTVDRQMGLNIVHPDGKVQTSASFAPDQIYFLVDSKNDLQCDPL